MSVVYDDDGMVKERVASIRIKRLVLGGVQIFIDGEEVDCDDILIEDDYNRSIEEIGRPVKDASKYTHGGYVSTSDSRPLDFDIGPVTRA